jgi:hypothetical protein
LPVPARLGPILTLCFAVITLNGCGMARQIAKDGSPGGVEGGLASIDDPQKQQQLGDVLDGPAGEGLGRGFIRGATAEGIAMLTGATQPSARPTSNPAGADQNATIEPGGGTDRPAQSVRGVVRDAALGLNDAFAESGDGADGGLLSGTRDVLGTALKLAVTLAIVLGLLVAALALGIWFILAKARRAREEARLHEAGTARLLDALRAVEGRPWAPEFAMMLQNSLESSAERKHAKPSRGDARDDDDDEVKWESDHRDADARVARHPGRAERSERA